MHRVAYAGEVKTIVWAADASGRRLGEEYRDDLSDQDQARIDALLRRMGNSGQIHNEQQFRHEGDGIYCFKKGLHRLPCFFNGNEVVVTHGFHKRNPKMPTSERERAQRIRDNYTQRGGRRDV